MRYALHVTLVAFVFLLTACETLVGPAVNGEPPRELTPAELRVVEADNTFGLNVFRALVEEAPQANVFISPLSISMALGMTLNGAAGETREAMQETLALHGLTEAEINEAYRELKVILQNLDPQVRFDIANSIWYRTGFAVEDDFLNKGREYFDAEIAELDFSRPDAPDIINRWIEDATEGLIEEMIDSIGGDVVMYLINAIYFKGDWMYRFDEANTRDETFTSADGREVTVPMMRQQDRLSFASTNQFLAVDLPYGDSLYSMTVLLPREGTSTTEIIAGLDAAAWSDIDGELRVARVDLKMPRFELSYEEELNDVLRALGMDVAFDPPRADFTRINRDGGIYISMVKHAAHVRVDEEGTEAAAATVVEMERTSAPLVHEVHLTRPFVFAIREHHSGSILFIGVANDVGG
jgi:serine protease inhibitor